MKELSENLIIAKNSLNTKYPWLLLVQFNVNDVGNTVHRFCQNYQDVIFDGETFRGFNFDLETIVYKGGDVPTTTLRISNVTQFLKSALEANRGCTASDIVLRIVHVDNLAEDYAELTINYDIVYPRITAKFVEFKLGSPSPLKRRVPTDRFYSDSCRFIFKDARCGYTGAETSCSRIRGRCRELNNEERFGGFPGLRAETIRLA